MTSSRPIEDHYATLGVSPKASHAEIRRARNRLLRQYHPDLNPNDVAHAQKRTVAIVLAAKVLLDDDARREYDRHYNYLFGNRRASAAPPPDDREYTSCRACGKPSQWKRNYCIYCGAAIERTGSTVRTPHHTESVTGFTDLRSQARTPCSWPEAGLNFGCGAVLGMVPSVVFGFRLVGAAGFEKESSFAIIVLAGVLVCGAAAAVLRERFWQVKTLLLFFLALYPLTLLLMYLMAALRRWTQDDERALLATAVVLLLSGAAAAVVARKLSSPNRR